MKKFYTIIKLKRKAVNFMLCLLLSFHLSCGVQKKKDTHNICETISKRSENNYEKNRKTPTSEIVKFSTFQKYKRALLILPLEDTLWMFYRTKIDIVSKDNKRSFEYQSLAKKEEGRLSVVPYGRPIFRYSPAYHSSKGIWSIDSEVILLFNNHRRYYFSKSGDFLRNDSAPTEKWWELKQGEYAKYNWTIEYGNGDDRLRFGHRKLPPTGNRRIPRKKISASAGYLFSGPWVLIHEHDFEDRDMSPSVRLILVNRRTAEQHSTFDYWQRANNRKAGFDFRVHEKGFYIDRVDDEGRHIPLKWFGEKVIDLDAGEDHFCYAFKGKRKCIDNAEHDLVDVVEMEKYRVFRTKKALFIEWFSPPSSD